MVIIVATLIVTTVILFVPFIGEAWVDAEMRFALFMVALAILVLVVMRWALPRSSEYQVMPPLEVGPSGKAMGEGASIHLAVGGAPYHQLRMYLELKSLFLDRMRMRRRLDDVQWKETLVDRPRLQGMVGDPDLFLLACFDDFGTTDLSLYDRYRLAFGEQFKDRFEALLRKVEEWN